MQDTYIGDEGNGFPLVLVHGFLGSSRMWGPQIDFFKDYFRVITPDLPGYGKSNKVRSHNNIQSMAHLLLDCLEEKKIDKFYLLGHSMGGMIVQEMAKKGGDKISKLVCYSTGPRGEMPGRFETVDQSRENLKKKGLEITAQNIAKTWFIKGENAKYFDICIEAGKQTSIETVDNALIAFKNWNGVDTLKNIKNETLIVWGDQDKSYNLEQIQTLEKNGYQSDPEIFKVPGAYELPLAVKNVAEKKKPDGIIALGAIVRGATPHFDYIATETAAGLTKVRLEYNIPVGFGVLTCDTMEQAIERSGEGSGNKGIESTEAVIGMIEFLHNL